MTLTKLAISLLFPEKRIEEKQFSIVNIAKKAEPVSYAVFYEAAVLYFKEVDDR